MTRVAILQSNYLPWRGYFDLMDDVNVFVIYDEVQYTKSDWRNRNKLKTRTGTAWLTVPVRRDGLQTRITDARIDWTKDWTLAQRQRIAECYSKAPFFDEVSSMLQEEFERHPDHLSALNVALLRKVAGRLGIKAQLVDSAQLGNAGGQTDRLVSIIQAVGGTTYLSGPAAQSYLDIRAFERGGITLEYKSYDYSPYPQLWGPFEGAVSILDLLMNTGPEARHHLKSRTPNLLVLS